MLLLWGPLLVQLLVQLRGQLLLQLLGQLMVQLLRRLLGRRLLMMLLFLLHCRSHGVSKTPQRLLGTCCRCGRHRPLLQHGRHGASHHLPHIFSRWGCRLLLLLLLVQLLSLLRQQHLLRKKSGIHRPGLLLLVMFLLHCWRHGVSETTQRLLGTCCW